MEDQKQGVSMMLREIWEEIVLRIGSKNQGQSRMVHCWADQGQIKRPIVPNDGDHNEKGRLQIQGRNVGR